MHNIHVVTFNLHSICMQLYLAVIFQTSIDAEIILHLITCIGLFGC